MRNRSITDAEIALIKAMRSKKMKVKDIQFYFNRPNRAVNSGRISTIENGTYSNSASIPPASDEDLKRFLATQHPDSQSLPPQPPHTQAPISPSTLQSLFVHTNGKWYLKARESDQHECKANFGLKHTGPWLRAIAALANNKGGYVIFGVNDKDANGHDDESYRVVGLKGQIFRTLDPAEISKRVRSTFDPTPNIQIASIALNDMELGFIYVERHDSRPVIATKPDGEHVKEGDIFFRYPGQSARIKYSDLRAVLDQRDVQSRMSILPLVQKLLELNPEKTMIADLSAGELMDGNRNIQIDESLLDKINFIREGTFEEKDGAPTLRLVGEVRVLGSDSKNVRRGIITKSDVLEDFLKQKTSCEPKEYIRFLVEGAQCDWLPLHFFAKEAKLDKASTVAMIKSLTTSQSRKEKFILRIGGKKSAYQKATGTPAAILKSLEAGITQEISSVHDSANVAAAIRGISKNSKIPLPTLLGLLSNCLEYAKDDDRGTIMSIVRRAACRVDELHYLEELKSGINLSVSSLSSSILNSNSIAH